MWMTTDKQGTGLIALLAAASLTGAACASAADDDTGAWLTGAFSGDLGDDDSPWLYSFDAQARYAEFSSGANQWLARPAVDYAFDNSDTAWVGYTRYRNRNRTGTVSDENRYWQQVGWKAGAFAGGNVSLRVRLEQRDISLSDEIRHAARIMAKYTRPLDGTSVQSLVLSAEPFFDLNSTDWGGGSGLAQYRLYAGWTWRLGSRTTLETGYMHQHIEVESGIDRTNHLGIIAFKMRLN